MSDNRNLQLLKYNFYKIESRELYLVRLSSILDQTLQQDDLSVEDRINVTLQLERCGIILSELDNLLFDTIQKWEALSTKDKLITFH